MLVDLLVPITTRSSAAVYSVVHHAIKRFGSPPAAIPRRATRRVANRQLAQAYPPQRGIGKRAAKDNARTASLAVERWDFWRHGLKRPLGRCKKAAPDVNRGPHARAARHRVRLSLVSLASQQSPTPFHQAPNFTISGGGSRKIPSGRLSPCLQKSKAHLPRSVLTNSYNVAERQPFQGEPRGESPPARCPKPTRRNAGVAIISPKTMQGQLRWRLSGGIFGGMGSSVRWGRRKGGPRC
jgi:hypothetical protein